MKNIIKKALGLMFVAGIAVQCNYLDVIPDNIPTLDHAFANRAEASRYLMTLYSWLPAQNDLGGNVGLTGSDETTSWHILTGSTAIAPISIVRGLQNRNTPVMAGWEYYYQAIRDCNIFIEYLSNEEKVPDLGATERKRWLGEAYFLKAYFHFHLMRMYGPVVLVRENLPIDAPLADMMVKRESFDTCVDYVVELLDTASEMLPSPLEINRLTELGRITRPVALTLKAKVLVTAASDLFNGNEDYTNFINVDGVPFFSNTSGTPDPAKWEAAAAACIEAIVACNEAGFDLYDFNSSGSQIPLSDATRQKLTINNAVTEPWTKEIIWGLSGRAANNFQNQIMSRIDPNLTTNFVPRDLMGPTVEITNNYYTNNGVPISEDTGLSWKNDPYIPRKATEAERFDLEQDYATASMHFEREPRFYAHLAFDGSLWYLESGPSGSGVGDGNQWKVHARAGGSQAMVSSENYSVTGYWAKKMVNVKYTMTSGGTTLEPYPWPELRVADLYLLYAESLVELNKLGDDPEGATYWLNKVRARAGFPDGVVKDWADHTNKASEATTQAGLRRIVRQERTNELMFEGQRFWDMRRWKVAREQLDRKTISGWSVDQESPEGYYNKRVLFVMNFVSPRDYLWPLMEFDIVVNPNLKQNPGWE